jgi:transposase InsO family protein
MAALFMIDSIVYFGIGSLLGALPVVALSLPVIGRIRAMGIRDRPISARSPWQNGYAERLIGSIRSDCLDHVVVFGERHLRNLLRSYQQYYNECRTHLSLDKDAPFSRVVTAKGRLVVSPVLGGLHHRYCRI